MSTYHKKLLAAVGGGFNPKGVRFDDVDSLQRGSDFTSNVDGKKGIFSFFIKMYVDDLNLNFFRTNNARFQIGTLDTNEINLLARDTSSNTVFSVQTAAGTILAANGWMHVLASWDVSSGVNDVQLYLDDAEAADNLTKNSNNDIDYTDTTHQFRGITGNDGFEIAEFYYNNAEYLDITLEANRRKFITADGKPVNLGNNGSLPTGSAPIVYLSLQSNTVNDFVENNGYGGDFAVSAGTLTEATTNPKVE